MRVSVSHSTAARVTAAGAAVAIAIPLGIVAAGPALATAGSSDAASITARKAPSSKLLTAAAFGAGWKAVPGSQMSSAQLQQAINNAAVSPAECKAALTLPAGYKSEAHRIFQKGSGDLGPYGVSAVAQFKNAKKAKKAVAKIKADVAANCSSVTVTVPQVGKVNATVSAASLPKIGDERVGYVINANVFIASVQARVSIVRVGADVAVTAQGGLGPVSAGSAKSLAKKSAAKL